MKSKEYIVSCILSGLFPVKYNKTHLYVSQMEPLDYIIVSDLKQQIYQDAIDDGLYTQEEWEDEMVKQGIWSVECEERIKFLEEGIENMKLALYESMFKSNTSEKIRKDLAIAREELTNLKETKLQNHIVTCDGYTDWIVLHHKVALSLRKADGSRVFPRSYKISSKKFDISDIVRFYNRDRLSEKDLRDLARTEPWKQYWASGIALHAEFFGPVASWTEEQLGIVGWSRLFDTIQQHPEYPGDDVAADDDVLDGWLIKLRRKREDDIEKRRGSLLLGKDSKASQASEVFIFAETAKDAARINKLNDSVSMMKKKQKLRDIPTEGEIKEADMPSVQRDLMMKAQQKFLDHVRSS
jgi:hypothetical protein